MSDASPNSRIPWEALRSALAEHAAAGLRTWIDSTQPHFSNQLAFALSRLDEGIALRHHCELRESLPARVDVLDLGAGNGGVAFAFANSPRYRVHTLDLVPNSVLRAVRRTTGLPVLPAVGNGAALPYADASFDVVLLIDAIEHVSTPGPLGEEIMRVLRPEGVCIVTTVARLRFLFRRDPHWGIPGLVALPNWLQRFVVNKLARRRNLGPGGATVPAYDVHHIYWHKDEIGALFPRPASVTAMYAWPIDPNARMLTREWLRYQLRGFVFDHVVVRKHGTSMGSRDGFPPES